MNVLVACVEDHAFEFRCEAGELNYSPAWPHFWMRRVWGDDWFQRVSCEVSTPPVDVRHIDALQFILYASRQDAEDFCAWIPKALSAVQEGYRTMRG
jgi:hypothetical protein